ncbi:MAG: putative LPS assembly protein LptD [Chitinophagales bacterium]
MVIRTQIYLLLFIFVNTIAFAQTDTTATSLNILADSILQQKADTLFVDTLTQTKDSLKVQTAVSYDLKMAKDTLEAPVKYSASDSMVYDIANEKIYLYGSAHIEQDKLNLDAERITFNYTAKTVNAIGVEDSLGNWKGKPLFKDSGQEFESDEITYNFDTKKGKIRQLVTQQGDGILIGEQVKKNENDEMFVQDAYYTTCNLEHPHYKIKVNKLKVIPKKLIVSGPAQLEIADIPTPLILPFGIFPLMEEQTSGVIFPSYGYAPANGYYLQRGGWYFAMGEYIDLALTGDIYSQGRWRLNAASRYKKRYHYTGNFNLEYGVVPSGRSFTSSFQKSRQFSVRWSHNQDPKSIPNSTFSSSVNFGTSSYNREFETSNEQVLTNTLSSSINYTKSFVGSPFRMTLNATHSQNTNTNLVDITLPNFSLDMSRINPLKRKKQIGKQKWYEQIYLTYNMDAKARVNAPDSVIFTNKIWDEVRSGMQQSASTGLNFKVFKYVNVSPNVNYREIWSLRTTRKEWVGEETYVLNPETDEIDTLPPYLNEFLVDGFTAGRQLNGGVSLTTKIFGMKEFRKGSIKAIRHEMTPNVGFTFTPDLSGDAYRMVQRNEAGDSTTYSIFEGGIYSGPNRARSASLSFGVNNNFQMKVVSRKDTTEDFKKIRILDRLNFSSSYNFLADSLHLAPINFNGGTNLFNKLRLDFGGSWSAYDWDADGGSLKDFIWTTSNHKQFLRLNSFRLSLNTSLSSKEIQKLTSKRGSSGEREEIQNNPNEFENFNIPWNFTVNYTVNLRKTRQDSIETNQVTQTLNFNGNLNLTEKWRLGFNSGYDFTNKALSRTTLNVSRDLHCWSMSFFISPIGTYKNYNFTLAVNSAVLQDLKLTRRRNWRDF